VTRIKRAELKKIGFEGPFPGSDHDYMVRGDNFVRIPNSHKREIGANLISEILRKVGSPVMNGSRLISNKNEDPYMQAKWLAVHLPNLLIRAPRFHS
jgi:hypothetical protein